MEETFLMIQQFNWRYRFFKRELTSLIFSDPELQEMYVPVHNNMLMIIRASVQVSITEGMFVSMDDKELDLFAEEIWLLTLFWLNYLEAGKEEVSEKSLARGSDLLRQAVKYRLTDKGRRAVYGD